MMIEPISQVEANLSEMMWMKPTARHRENILQISGLSTPLCECRTILSLPGGLGFRGIKYKAVEQIKCQDRTELPSPRLSPQEPPQTIPVRLTPLPGGWWGLHEVTQDLFPRHSGCYMVEVMGLGLVARRVPTPSAVVKSRVRH